MKKQPLTQKVRRGLNWVHHNARRAFELRQSTARKSDRLVGIERTDIEAALTWLEQNGAAVAPAAGEELGKISNKTVPPATSGDHQQS